MKTSFTQFLPFTFFLVFKEYFPLNYFSEISLLKIISKRKQVLNSRCTKNCAITMTLNMRFVIRDVITK